MVTAFTDFGIENRIEGIKFYKENPESLKQRSYDLRRMGYLESRFPRLGLRW